MVLGNLSEGLAGFRELSRAVDGDSDSVLSDRLSDLAEALIARPSTKARRWLVS